MKAKGLWKSTRLVFDGKCQPLKMSNSSRDIKEHSKKITVAVFFDAEKAFDTTMIVYRSDDLAKGFLT